MLAVNRAPESAGEEEKERVRRLGKLDYKALKAAITPGTRAVVMTHASNLTGNRTDLKKVGRVVQTGRSPFYRRCIPDSRSFSY